MVAFPLSATCRSAGRRRSARAGQQQEVGRRRSRWPDEVALALRDRGGIARPSRATRRPTDDVVMSGDTIALQVFLSHLLVVAEIAKSPQEPAAAEDQGWS